jgi:hypothetical protein
MLASNELTGRSGWRVPGSAPHDGLHRLFAQPWEVVADGALTTEEKRTILASWASDACAVDTAPGLRRVPGSGSIVGIDDILEALRALDRRAGDGMPSWARRRVRRASIEAFRERQRAAN